jgi:hypothetical protein
MSYEWAANKTKLDRALKVYPQNEEKCKELYISLGGYVLETTTHTPETTTITSNSTSTSVAEGNTMGSEPISMS